MRPFPQHVFFLLCVCMCGYLYVCLRGTHAHVYACMWKPESGLGWWLFPGPHLFSSLWLVYIFLVNFLKIYFIVRNSQIETSHSQIQGATQINTFPVPNSLQGMNFCTVRVAILRPWNFTQDFILSLSTTLYHTFLPLKRNKKEKKL